MRVAESTHRLRRLAAVASLAVAVIVAGAAGVAAEGFAFKAATVAGSNEVIRWECGTHPVYSSGLDRADVVLLRRALRQVSRATGIRFKYEGETGIKDVVDGAIHVRSIDFEAGNLAPASASRVNEGTTYTAAVVNLNKNVPLDSRYTMNVLLHELGHAVGLDHVDSYEEVMSGVVLTGDTAYEHGDLKGLETVGCQAEADAPPPPAPGTEPAAADLTSALPTIG